jgi:hypothetical protein
MSTSDPKRQQIPPVDFKPIDHKTLDKVSKERMESFADLLDSISSLEDKKKALWKHIYENAITDRNNAYLCFADLYIHVHNDPSGHGIHGQTIAKYLERMSKSTDQLLKLVELLSEVEENNTERDSDLEPSDIYSKIGDGKFTKPGKIQ